MTSGFVNLIRYSGTDSDDATDHLVREERESEVVTACGLTLRKKDSTSISWTSGGYIHLADEPIPETRCGNCPWGDVGE